MRYDVVIVGGSFAGLAAALYLARAHRTVCVVDTSRPRNRFAKASHGFFTHDGSDPLEMLATMRRQVSAYPTVRFVDAAALDARLETGSFKVDLSDGAMLEASRLLLAFGISDTLPGVPGLAERWGRSALHCPYCHGYEVSGRRLGVMYVAPPSIPQVKLVAEWGPTTFFLNGTTVEEAELEELRSRGIQVERAPIMQLLGNAPELSAARLADGGLREVDALFLSPRNRLNSEIADQLGCSIVPSPLGGLIVTDDDRATTVAGVFAAGDIARASHNITFACADGVTSAMAIHRSLFLVPQTTSGTFGAHLR
jgi:thioredoxin reductase